MASGSAMRRMMRLRRRIAPAICIAALLCGSRAAQGQAPGEAPLAPEELKASIDRLGNLDHTIRTNAARAIRRAPGNQAVPALLDAVVAHADGYVRYRALVLLTGFSDFRIRNVMQDAMASPNDRLRSVAYSYFEKNPDPELVPLLLDALE